MKANVIEIKIITDYIELQQLLKKIDLISSGGEAKIFLLNNEIKVDGEYENRRGKKLYPGNLILINGVNYLITK